MLLKKIFSLNLILLIASVLSSQNLSFTPLPGWVKLQDSLVESTVNKYEVQNGYYVLGLDIVSHYDKKAVFSRTRSKIIHHSGISILSQINIEYDSSFQKVYFHSYKIQRDGITMDRTKNLDFTFLSNEENLNSNIIRGTITANAILKDIRKGDILEFSYTIVGENPLFKGQYHELQFLQSNNHIDQLYYTFIAPIEMDFNFTIRDETDLEIKDFQKSKNRFLEIRGFNIKPVELEETMSLAVMPYNCLEISLFDKWIDVKNWAKELFPMEESAGIDSVFNLLCKNEKDIISKATKILDFTQNKIRYTSINGGIKNFKATSPSEVLSYHYGDCKDKSLLLVHLLKKLGIKEVYPALVNSYNGHGINSFLPGYLLFDHVIVKCILDENELWLDPTLYLQGGDIMMRKSFDFGYALVIDDLDGGLERMKVDEDFSTTEIYEDFDFSDVSGEGSLEVITIFKGKNADLIRNMYDQYSPKELADLFKETYSILYLDVRSNNKPKVEDNYQENIFRIVESYTIEEPWTKLTHGSNESYSLSYEPVNIYNFLTPMACDKIKYPIDTEMNKSFKQNTKIKLPEDAIYKLNNFSTENAMYNFKKHQKIVSLEQTEINYDYKIITRRILPDDFPVICKDINSDCRSLVLNIIWFKH